MRRRCAPGCASATRPTTEAAPLDSRPLNRYDTVYAYSTRGCAVGLALPPVSGRLAGAEPGCGQRAGHRQRAPGARCRTARWWLACAVAHRGLAGAKRPGRMAAAEPGGGATGAPRRQRAGDRAAASALLAWAGPRRPARSPPDLGRRRHPGRTPVGHRTSAQGGLRQRRAELVAASTACADPPPSRLCGPTPGAVLRVPAAACARRGLGRAAAAHAGPGAVPAPAAGACVQTTRPGHGRPLEPGALAIRGAAGLATLRDAGVAAAGALNAPAPVTP